MSFSQKIDLENFIFTRAAFFGVEVVGVRGELTAYSTDILLHVMMSVYNAFFAEENVAVEGEAVWEDITWEQYEYLMWVYIFEQEAKRLGPLGNSGILLEKSKSAPRCVSTAMPAGNAGAVE